MAANDRVIKLTIVGNADSGERALKQTAAAATQAEVKVEGFGKAFAKLGVVGGVAGAAAAAGVGLLTDALRAGAQAAVDYNAAIQSSETRLRALGGSEQAVADAQAIARRENEAGRGTYLGILDTLALLTPASQRYRLSLEQLLPLAQQLAALNPAEGLQGATVAINEALSGDFTSLAERFNLPRNEINKLKAEGVPAAEIIARSLAAMGVSMELVNEQSEDFTAQSALLSDALQRLAAEGGKPVFDEMAAGIRELNEALKEPIVKDSIEAIARGLRIAIEGRTFEAFGLQAAEAFGQIATQYDRLLKTLTGGRLRVFGLEDFLAGVAALRDDLESAIAEPISRTLKGEAPGSPLAPAKVQGYGAEVLRNYLAGLTGGGIGEFEQFAGQFERFFKDASGKLDTDAFEQSKAVIATALQEIRDKGQLTIPTFNALNAVFGDQAFNVAALVNAYGQLQAAQSGAAATSTDLSQSQAGLQSAIDGAKRKLGEYQAALESATRAAQDHADRAAAAIEPLADALQDVGKAAAASARESADRIDALQEAAAARAEAYAAQQERAQAELAAIQERRREEARKLYDTIVDGERRALDAANNRVNALSRQANKDDLAALRAIQAARDAGNTREAARLTRQLDMQRKKRAGAMEIARAEAAVAKDDFDVADERAKREVKAIDDKAAREEEAAKARLAQIQEAAKQQAAADKAAIDGAQDAAKAEAERYRKQQEGLQAEIDRIQDAAREQAKKDQAAIVAARANFAEQQTLAGNLETALGRVEGRAKDTATSQRETANAAKETYDWMVKMLPYAVGLADAADREARARSAIANLPAIMPGGRSPYDETPPYVPPSPPQQPGPAGGGGMPTASALRRDWDGLVRGGI